jgi:hypothetical protein
LLQRKPVNRLGLKGAAEVKDHPWIKNYSWKELAEKKLESPFIPRIGDNFDKKYCESADKIGMETKDRYDNYLRSENFQNVFKNFTYNTTIIEPVLKRKPLHEPRSSSSRALNFTAYSNNSAGSGTNLNAAIKPKKPNGYSHSYNMLYSTMITNLKKSNDREKSHNNSKTILKIEKSESGLHTNRSSSIKVIKSPIQPAEKLDTAKLKKLINSSSTNNIFKIFKNPLNKNKSISSTSSLVYLTNKKKEATTGNKSQKNSFI